MARQIVLQRNKCICTHLALASDARGVDEAVSSAPPLEHGVDGISSGARNVTDDSSRLSEQPVEQARPEATRSAKTITGGDLVSGLSQ